MNPVNRTLAFLLTAICSVGIAWGAHVMFQPSAEGQKSDVGTEFYPDFRDPALATSLTVAAFNSTASKVDKFSIEKRDGQWRIPSHHNYTADGRDRLARTAASLIGVTRGQLYTESADSHARLKLLDPLDDKVVDKEAVGSRITLKAGDEALTDLIIGSKVEGGSGDRYYIRRADEARVYISEIRPDLSTKFVDWIQPNVLDATAANFRKLILDRYRVEFVGPQGKQVQGPKSLLTRDSSTDEWKLDGTIEPGKKLKTTVVNQMVSGLADMKIVGVRPKTPGLAALVKGDEKTTLTSIDKYDMDDKGFYLTGGGIASNDGDFLAGTSEGIVYVLRFGRIVAGEDVDIEIGSSKKLTEEEAKAALESKQAKAGDPAKPDEKEAKPDDPKEGEKEEKKENRFLFVSVQLDETLLGTPPVEPVKPTPPPGYTPKEKPAEPEKKPMIPGFTDPGSKPAAPAPGGEKKETSAISSAAVSLAGPGADPVAQDAAAQTPATEKAPDAAPSEPKAQEVKPADTPPAPPATETETAAAGEEKPVVTPKADDKPAVPEAPKDPVAEYEAALVKYEQAMDEYKVAKGEYDEKLKKAREREKALNARFADWYYVIPADVFNTINVKPEELVEADVAVKPEGGAAAPGGSPFQLPEGLGLPPGLGQPGGTPKPPAAPPADSAAPKESTPPVGDPPKEGAAKPEGETPKAQPPAAAPDADAAAKAPPAETPKPE